MLLPRTTKLPPPQSSTLLRRNAVFPLALLARLALVKTSPRAYSNDGITKSMDFGAIVLLDRWGCLDGNGRVSSEATVPTEELGV